MFKVDISKIRKVLAKIQKTLESEADAALMKTAKEGARYAKKIHRFKNRGPNGLHKNIVAVSISPLVKQIQANKPYARYINDGTPPHEIAAKNKPLLAFKIRGKWCYAKKVMHPGTKPDPFFTRTYADIKVTMPEYMRAALTRII